jgi:hypothetical protein
VSRFTAQAVAAEERYQEKKRALQSRLDFDVRAERERSEAGKQAALVKAQNEIDLEGIKVIFVSFSLHATRRISLRGDDFVNSLWSLQST